MTGILGWVKRGGRDIVREVLYEFSAPCPQEARVGGAKTFVAVGEADQKTILRFYSLSPAWVEYARTPAIVKRGLGRYDVPGFRLARLGVDRKLQGLGGQLLAEGRRCLYAAAEVGGVKMAIDAKNEGVADWYARYGAVRLDDEPLRLMLALATVEAALRGAGKY